MTPITLRTSRLLLRPWKDADIEPFVAMNGDARVCEFYPTDGFTRTESLAFIARTREEMTHYGFGLWAVEEKSSGQFIGYVGLKHLRMTHPLAPNVEIGWRLAPDFWGNGYASEAAREALRYGFEELALPEIVAFTAIPNRRSQAVMKRIGMVADAARNFEHPEIATGNALRPHVAYALSREEFLKKQSLTEASPQ